ncbi:MAG: hypothetical protein ACUVX8_11200 [Candidatus Zipacnadales bacterium]
MDALERAGLEIREQNYGNAIRTLETLTARDPLNAEAYKLLARAYHGMGDKQKAAEAAVRYTSLRPADAGGHYNAGVLLAQIGQMEAAERSLRAALTADPGHAKARRALHALTEKRAGSPQMPALAPTAPLHPERKKGMPWQGKVAAALTIVASLAIILWLFLPGGPALRGLQRFAPERTKHEVTTPPPQEPTATDPTLERRPQDVPQVKASGQQTPAPTPYSMRQPIEPLPKVKDPQQAAPAAQNVWRQVWQSRNTQYSQRPQKGGGDTGDSSGGMFGLDPDALDQMLAARETGGSAAASEPIAGDQTPAPQQAAQPSRTQTTQRQSRQPAPPAQAPQPQPLFTPQEAERVVQAIDDAERRELQGALGYLANWLRHDPACNDPDFWPILQTALATTGPSMAPQGLTFGVAEVMTNIVNADTAWEAADRLEYQSRNLKSVLPYTVKVQIAQALARSTSAEEAYRLVDWTLRQNNTSVSNYATQVLIDAALKAERERQKIEERLRQRTGN